MVIWTISTPCTLTFPSLNQTLGKKEKDPCLSFTLFIFHLLGIPEIYAWILHIYVLVHGSESSLELRFLYNRQHLVSGINDNLGIMLPEFRPFLLKTK